MTQHRAPDIDKPFLIRVLVGRMRADGISVRTTAAKIGISPSNISRVIGGSSPDLASYIKICQWLGVSLDTFVGIGDLGGGRATRDS